MAFPDGGVSPPDTPDGEPARLRNKALSGAVLLAVRGFGIKLLGLVGYLVIARILTPRDFGVAALGLSLVFFTSFIADSGLGAALIRLPEPPSQGEYASVVGAQLAVMSVAIAGAAMWLCFAQNTVAAVALVYAAGLPAVAFRLPSAIGLERELNYRPLVFSDVAEVLTYTVWSIVAVLCGLGVFGLATGAVARTAVGTLVLNRLGPIGWLRPQWHFGRVRRLLGFGLKFQLTGAVALAREQVINLGTAAILGYPTLGLWALVTRVLSVPLLVFDSLWRVSFPTFSRMLAAGHAVDDLMRRSVANAGFLGGLIYLPLAICMPDIVPALIGHRWSPALVVLPLILFGLAASLPISVVANGFLLARGEPGALLRVNLGFTSVYFVTAFGLMPFIGYFALGVGQATAAVTDGWLLSRAVHRFGGPRLFRHALPPLVTGSAVFGVVEAGRALFADDLASAVGAAAVGGLLYVMLAWATTPTVVTNAVRLVLTLRSRLRPA